MNGKMVVSKPLYVALAQRKEERRARLQVIYHGNYFVFLTINILLKKGAQLLFTRSIQWVSEVPTITYALPKWLRKSRKGSKLQIEIKFDNKSKLHANRFLYCFQSLHTFI